ncbi:hypothetical protein AK812_SmicGene5864 [Symbiodinium microadriaticum]|uniref:Uncharacterized protein n=1 Tax=Symbiodinium microadriaticum TaxID=2951 RepID=A0A1Q9ESQ5_SYMMI|nr:hypothetical protein AK812_SmicGene5864 [Symbiodinium microadriaticum]
MKDDGDDDRLRMVIVILAMNVPKQTRKLMNAMMIMTAKAFETMTTMIPATKPPLTMNLLVLLLLQQRGKVGTTSAQSPAPSPRGMANNQDEQKDKEVKFSQSALEEFGKQEREGRPATSAAAE